MIAGPSRRPLSNGLVPGPIPSGIALRATAADEERDAFHRPIIALGFGQRGAETHRATERDRYDHFLKLGCRKAAIVERNTAGAAFFFEQRSDPLDRACRALLDRDVDALRKALGLGKQQAPQRERWRR